MTEIYIAKRVIDYLGLGARGVPEGTLPVIEKLQPTLSLLQGMAADGAKLLNVDANGSLQVTQAGQFVSGGMFIQNGSTAQQANTADVRTANLNGFVGLIVLPALYDGSGNGRQPYAASAVNLAAQSGLGAQITALPGEWAVVSTPAVGVAAAATKIAGGAGVRHILKSFSFSMSSQAALGGVTTVTFSVMDGGAVLFSWTFDLPAAIIAPLTFGLSGLNVVGTAATLMQVVSDGAHAGLRVSANLSGYDAA
jgi:hypothetical protein